MLQYIYLVPLFPLVGFLINGLGWRRMPHKAAGVIASLMMLAAFCVSVGIFFEVKDGASATVNLFDFINYGSLNIPMGLEVDALSSLFLLIITGVGFLIHVYSASYMGHDDGVVRYFAYLNLFVFSMLILVLGSSYLTMFIGWEGVGLCSYLLIGFWFKNRDYTAAAKKAFVMNRIGDLGFLIGMMLVLYHYGIHSTTTGINLASPLSYDQLLPALGGATPETSAAGINTWIAICFFIGAMGKSAQIPLFTWLPDAMAGPTPVSALIHAATMVTAGIYMIARSSALYNLAPMALHFIGYIGLATALVAATIAIKQYDIKKVLAYSTVSQLGFMFMALGAGAYTTAVFHVMTHAFFKALLFLGSGSVIHAMGGEQDMRIMGGLGKKMRITQITFLIGCLAIAGIPGFSGFFSKDEILAAHFEHNPIIYWGGILAAMMTAFYMFRCYTLTFTGRFRGTHEQEHHLHESPVAMTLPLVALAILSVIGGYVGMPEVFGAEHQLGAYLSRVVANTSHHLEHNKEWIALGISSAVAIVFSIAGWAANSKPVFAENKGVAKFLEQKWYIDELYNAVIVNPLNAFSRFLDRIIERLGIDGLINGVGRTVRYGSERIRLVQSGQVGFYIFIMVLGISAILAIGFFVQI